MKYILLISFLIPFMGCNNSNGPVNSLGEYKGYVLVQKGIWTREDMPNTYEVWIEKDLKVKRTITVRYWYDKYNVGDTIK